MAKNKNDALNGDSEYSIAFNLYIFQIIKDFLISS